VAARLITTTSWSRGPTELTRPQITVNPAWYGLAMATEESTRAAREREYFDQEYASEGRELDKWYSIADEATNHWHALVRGSGVAGSRILEIGCGPEGGLGVELAAEGARVTGIDISPVAVGRAEEEAARRGLSEVCDFQAMDAEHLGFNDAEFDVVCGGAILHHLDLHRAFAEIARTMKPEGRAVFLEPLGHNPLIRAFRARTPEHRTPDEHPLLVSDLAAARTAFATVRARFFNLTVLAAVPFQRTALFGPLSSTLASFDRRLLELVPRLRKHAWMVVLQLGDPR
jgi:SAM-dependent methyltransferase